MKKYISLLFLFCFTTSYSQEGWFYQDSGTTDDLLCVFFIDSDYGWVGSKQGTVFKTTDGGESWNAYLINSNYGVLSMYFINSDTGWCVNSSWSIGVGDIFKTTDGGLNWEQKFTTGNILTSISFVDENNGWAVGNGINIGIGGQCFKTTDGGESWFVSYTFEYYVPPRDVYFQDENIGYIVSGGIPSRIFKTFDGGFSWNETRIGFNISQISFSDSMYGMTAGWNSSGWQKSFARTTDGGENWEEFLTDYYLTGTYVISNQYPFCWVISDAPPYIFNSTDFGNNLFVQLKPNTLLTPWLNDIYFVNDSIGWVVGANGAILKTINGGTPEVGEPKVPILLSPGNGDTLETQYPTFVWGAIEYSMYQIQISTDSLFVNIVTNCRMPYYYFQTQLDSLTKYYWRVRSENINGFSDWTPIRYFYTGYVVSGIVNEIEQLKTFSLSQNYPNPFNPTTKIKYTIPNVGDVSLKVYDVLGKEIATLVNEEKPAGEYEIQFNGNDLPTGIYFYQLKAGNFVETKKMILLR